MPASRLGPLGRTLLVAGQVSIDRRSQRRRFRFPRSSRQDPRSNTDATFRARHGCDGCHGVGLSGGYVEGPPGAPPAANLTPHASGLEKWTEADFERALRHGVRPNGTPINIFMPWPNFSGMTDDEVKALWLYLRSVPAKPVGNK